MSIHNAHKERLVDMFLRGESVTDLSAFYAVPRRAIEAVLREAIVGLAKIAANVRNDTNEAPKEQPPELICEHCGQPDPNQDHFDAWTDDLPQGGWCCEAPKERQV